MVTYSLKSLDASFLAKIGKVLSFALMAALWADFMASKSEVVLDLEELPLRKTVRQIAKVRLSTWHLVWDAACWLYGD